MNKHFSFHIIIIMNKQKSNLWLKRHGCAPQPTHPTVHLLEDWSFLHGGGFTEGCPNLLALVPFWYDIRRNCWDSGFSVFLIWIIISSDACYCIVMALIRKSLSEWRQYGNSLINMPVTLVFLFRDIFFFRLWMFYVITTFFKFLACI